MKRVNKTIPKKVSRGSISVPHRLRILNKTQMHAVLATDSDGKPYTSLIAYALTPDLKGIIFSTPKTTRKYKNILRNNHVSLLIDTRSNTKKDYMSAESVTIIGNARPERRRKEWLELAQVLKKKHPELSEFIDSPETAGVFVKITRCIHVTKFQSVSEWNLKSRS
jgi:nitroimidazol reductase NimA-like FMN-containing flavoprotein (pyridoxamine 5'-phosphate oxidase superfamily)